jgi:cobalamin biosynthesis Mg chelatase CobN
MYNGYVDAVESAGYEADTLDDAIDETYIGNTFVNLKLTSFTVNYVNDIAETTTTQVATTTATTTVAAVEATTTAAPTTTTAVTTTKAPANETHGQIPVVPIIIVTVVVAAVIVGVIVFIKAKKRYY